MTVTEHEMVVADPVEPVRYTWNGNPDDREEMRRRFEQLMSTGLFVASRSTGVPGRLEQIDEFDPDARSIVLRSALQGG